MIEEFKEKLAAISKDSSRQRRKLKPNISNDWLSNL